MASEIRKEWQSFKKKHPLFEKSKNFKSDVGPQLDKFDKARDEHEVLARALDKKRDEIVGLGKSVAAALKGYEVVVKDLEAVDKSIKADMGKSALDGDFFNCYVKTYTKKVDLT